MDKTVKNKYAVGLSAAVTIKDGASLFTALKAFFSKEDDWQASCRTLWNEHGTVSLHIDGKCHDVLFFV